MVLTGLRRLCERGALGFAFWALPAVAQSSPTVTGPDAGAPLRVPELPGPESHALSHAVRVQFEGDCISPRPLVNEVARWLGQDRIDDRVTIEVSGSAKPLRAHFWLLVSDERRALRRFEDFSGTCAELAESLAAAIALAIEAVELPPRRATLPPVVTKPQPWSPPLPKRRRAKGVPREPVIQSFAVGGHGLFAMGATYGPAWGGGFRSELGLPHSTSVRLGGHYLGAAPEQLAEGSVHSRALGAELGACWGSGERLRTKLCMDTWVGTLHVQGRDLSRASAANLTTLTLVPGAEARFPAGEGLGAYFGLHGLVNLSRPRVEVRLNSHDSVLAQLQLPPFGFLVALGIDGTWL